MATKSDGRSGKIQSLPDLENRAIRRTPHTNGVFKDLTRADVGAGKAPPSKKK